MARILISDDDPEIREALARLLTHTGHEVVTVPDGRACMRELEAGSFDLLITDILMPEQDGLETLMSLRRSGQGPRVIAMSGGGQGSAHDYLDLAKRFGASRILPKPFPVEDLLKAVDEVLAEAGG